MTISDGWMIFELLLFREMEGAASHVRDPILSFFFIAFSSSLVHMRLACELDICKHEASDSNTYTAFVGK